MIKDAVFTYIIPLYTTIPIIAELFTLSLPYMYVYSVV